MKFIPFSRLSPRTNERLEVQPKRRAARAPRTRCTLAKGLRLHAHREAQVKPADVGLPATCISRTSELLYRDSEKANTWNTGQ